MVFRWSTGSEEHVVAAEQDDDGPDEGTGRGLELAAVVRFLDMLFVVVWGKVLPEVKGRVSLVCPWDEVGEQTDVEALVRFGIVNDKNGGRELGGRDKE